MPFHFVETRILRVNMREPHSALNNTHKVQSVLFFFSPFTMKTRWRVQFTFDGLDACDTCDYDENGSWWFWIEWHLCHAMRFFFDSFFFSPFIWIMETVRNSQYLLSISLLRIQSQKWIIRRISRTKKKTENNHNMNYMNIINGRWCLCIVCMCTWNCIKRRI